MVRTCEFYRYQLTCHEVQNVGCDCSGCCFDEFAPWPPPPPLPPGSPPPPPPFAMDIQFLADHPGADWQIGLGLLIAGIIVGRCVCNKGRGGRGGYVPGPPPKRRGLL